MENFDLTEFEALAADGQLWLIEYSSSRWAGAGNTVVVIARDEDHARASSEVDMHMEEEMRELYWDEDNEDEESVAAAEDCSYVIDSIEPFGPDHDTWEFFCDSEQRAAFYPIIDTSKG